MCTRVWCAFPCVEKCDKGVCAVVGCVHGLQLAGGCAVECEYDKELD